MAFDGPQHIVAKQAAQKGQGAELVQVVHAAFTGRVAQIVQQMAQVVQQRCRHQRVAGTGLFGQVGGLQRVFQLGNGFAAVLFVATAGKQLFNVVDGEGHGFLEVERRAISRAGNRF